MEIARPYALAAATTSVGALLGLIPQIGVSIDTLTSRAPSVPYAQVIWSMFYLTLFGGLLATAIITGLLVSRGKSKADKFLEELRSRPTYRVIG